MTKLALIKPSSNSILKNLFFKYNWFLFSVLLLIYVMYPAFIYGEFLFHDDLGSIRTICPFTPWLDILGRPLGDKVACVQFAVLHYFGAPLARIFTILSLMLLQLTTYKFLKKEGFPDYLAVFMAFGLMVLPGMLVYVSWLTSAYIVFSLLFSAFSALLCQKILKEYKINIIYAALLSTTAILFELSSDFTHQNGGMFFLVFFAISVACAFYHHAALFRAIFVYSVVFLPANIIYYMYFKFKIAATLAPQDPTRGILFRDFMGHITWFFNYSFPRAINLWFKITTSGWSIISSCMLVIFLSSLSIFLYSHMRNKNTHYAFLKVPFYILFLFAIMLGCYLPTLASSMYLDFFRALVPLSAFFLLMTFVHFYMVFNTKFIIIKNLLGLLMLIVAFISSQTMLNQMVMPKYLEFQYLKHVVQQIKIHHLENVPIHVIRTSMLPETNGLNTDEIGSLNTTFRGHGVVLVEYMRKQLNLPYVMITDSRPGESFDLKGKILIDFSVLSLHSLKNDLEKLPLQLSLK